jgi:hypothetical protein
MHTFYCVLVLDSGNWELCYEGKNPFITSNLGQAKEHMEQLQKFFDAAIYKLCTIQEFKE